MSSIANFISIDTTAFRYYNKSAENFSSNLKDQINITSKSLRDLNINYRKLSSSFGCNIYPILNLLLPALIPVTSIIFILFSKKKNKIRGISEEVKEISKH